MSGRVAKPIKHIRFNDWLYLMCVDIDIDSIITRFAIDTHKRTANSIDINLWLTYNKTHRIDRKKPNAFGQQHQGEKNGGTNSKWQPMNKCACVDYMVRCYNLLTIENWQRKKVNAVKKKIRSNPHVHCEYWTNFCYLFCN